MYSNKRRNSQTRTTAEGREGRGLGEDRRTERVGHTVTERTGLWAVRTVEHSELRP